MYIYNLFRLCTQLYSYALFGAESCLKKNLEYESILHNFTELLVDWTSREFQKQTILFPKKISDIHRERLMFHSIQCRNFWLAASDLFDMFTQSIYTSIIYRCLKNAIHQIDSKHGWLLPSASFTAKFELVFVLTLENAFS